MIVKSHVLCFCQFILITWVDQLKQRMLDYEVDERGEKNDEKKEVEGIESNP